VKQGKVHGSILLLRIGLPYNEKVIGPGAQASRLDEAGPVKKMLARMASPAAFSVLTNA
jgi:hypothetical protein